MTTLGAVFVLVAAAGAAAWILDLVRRGELYVGYGIVLLALLLPIAGLSIFPAGRLLVASILSALYPAEPVAVAGLAAVLILLIYVLHQLSVLSDRVATLTQEIALREARREKDDVPKD